MALPFEQHVKPQQWAELKGEEHDQIQTLIDRDEKEGTLNPTQAAEYHVLNERGRLLLYGVGGEFDDYLSRDELNANLTEETRTTTIMLFNPAWGDGKAEVALGELSQAFDRREAVALVDTLRSEQGLEIEGLEWDAEHRKVFAAVKNKEGKFRIEMNLDDGSHDAPVYHVTDKNGEVAEIGNEDLSHLGIPPYKPLPGQEQEAGKSASAVPENRAGTLNQKFTVMAKFKKQFFREGGMPERSYQQEPRQPARAPSERTTEKPSKSSILPKGPTPSMPTGGGEGGAQTGAQDRVRPAHHDTPAKAEQPAAQPVPQPEPQRPNRFAGPSALPGKKGPSLWPALAAGGVTGGTLIGGASATGLFTLLFRKHEEITAFLQSFFA